MSEREPTTLGWFIMRKMAAHQPPLTQSALARRSGLAQSSISRYIYDAGRPDTDKLSKLSAGLAALDDSDREQIYQELLALAGHGHPAEGPVEAHPMHRLAREIGTMLDDTSPMPADKRIRLEEFLDDMLEYYRPLMRRRRPA